MKVRAVQTRRNRQTGTHVSVLMIVEGKHEGRYALRCKEHRTTRLAASRKVAKEASRTPRGWCSSCAKLTERLEKQKPRKKPRPIKKVKKRKTDRIDYVVEKRTRTKDGGWVEYRRIQRGKLMGQLVKHRVPPHERNRLHLLTPEQIKNRAGQPVRGFEYKGLRYGADGVTVTTAAVRLPTGRLIGGQKRRAPVAA